ncbi:MAG TPA: hypothetical protein VFR68_00670, partial [Candidatus Dormibacteraeota bacterium]|nr:hypothetical protein [Candidatus Dormibacteraeota bacterium]
MQVGPLPVNAATPTGKPTNAPGKLNLFNPATLATSARRAPGLAAAAGQTKIPPPGNLRHPVPLPMQPAVIDLDPTVSSRFLGSDGRLEIDVPLGAVTADDLVAAGGHLNLSLRQIAPASGSTGGGNGFYSFGTYLAQTVDGQKHEWTHPLRKPLSFKLHVNRHELAFNLRGAVLVFNGAFPLDTNFNPDPAGPFIPAAQVHLSASASVKATFNTSDSTLVATASMPSDPAFSFNTDSPDATFGKPDVFNADLSAGALSASYPIEVPAGPGGLKPPINLVYNSAGLNEQHNPQGAAPWVGEGWNLSLGSISWAEHNVAAGCEANGTCAGDNFENTWELNDPFGTSAELIPASPAFTSTSTFCDKTNIPTPSATPGRWYTTPDSHAKVFDYTGTFSLPCTIGTQSFTPPCFRVFLPNGIMEEFGCSSDNGVPPMQYWPWSGNSNDAVNQWLLDLITDPQGNQIHLNYQVDTATSSSRSYPRDIVLSSIEWDDPTCHNAQSRCSSWNPLMRVNFSVDHAVGHVAGASCPANGNLRCDDPIDLSGSAGMANPLVQNTYVLNDIQVQVRSSGGTTAWNTLRDYQLWYDQSSQTTITDPVTAKQESVAGKLTLSQLADIGDDNASTLPTRTFGYTKVTRYYEDDAWSTATTSNCPSWNKGQSGITCALLWSQSYDGNSWYLASASNGLGLSQSFGWILARNNTHGVNGGGANNTNPFYCTQASSTVQSSYPCDEADDQSWSRVVLTQQSGTVLQQSQGGQGGNQAATPVNSTISYNYALAQYRFNACSDCFYGFYWGNQKDGDYADYYNSKFMGFAQASLSRPDGSAEIHKYHSSLGWGVYDCAQVSCAVDTGPPHTWCYQVVCQADPWWPLSNSQTNIDGTATTVNALHGHEYLADYTDTNGTTILHEVKTLYNALCRPVAVASGSPSNGYGSWDGQLVSELDPSNPVGLCDIQTAQVVVADEGTVGSSVPQKTTTYTYDSYGRMSSQQSSSNDGTATGSPITIVHKPTYATNDNIASSSTSATGSYLVTFPAFTDTEDSAGNRTQCSYTLYDGNTNEGSSSISAGLVTSVNRYTNCGTPANSFNDRSGKISASQFYDSSGYGNPVATKDPDANAVSGTHVGCTIAGTPYSTCTTYDSTYAALPISRSNALNQTAQTNFQSPSTATAAGGFGLWPMSSADVNQQTTAFTYDPLGRQTSVTPPPIQNEAAGLTTSTTSYESWCTGSAAQSPCVEVDHNQRPGNEAGGIYVPVSATRICDTRTGSGTSCAGQTLAANTTLNLKVTGQGGIPSSGVAAVVLDVAVTNPTASGYLTVYPAGSVQPAGSNLNFVAGQTIANLVQVPVGSNGQVSFFTFSSSTDLIVDVQGYVASTSSGTAGLMNALKPSSRLCDTRTGYPSNQCTGQTIPGGGTLNVQVTGQGGVPTSGVQAVVLNVGATSTASSGYLKVYPAGQAAPSVSNLNWSAGQTIANRVVVPVGTGGQVTLANPIGGSTDVFVDVFAWTTDGTSSTASGAEYGALLTSRVCDTRIGSGTACARKTLAPNTPIQVQIAGTGGVPSMSSVYPPQAVDVNVTVLNPTASGVLIVYPNGTGRPSTSDLNFAAGQTIANLDMVVALGPDGKLTIYNLGNGSADIILDVGGYYAAGPSGMAISRAFYDGWGHLVETRAFGPNNQDVVRYQTYDASGRLAFQSTPYFVPAYAGPPGFPAFSPPDTTQPGTTNTYDGLGRVTSTKDALSDLTTNTISVACNAVGTTVISGTTDPSCYEQTVTVDPNNHQRTGLVDALGRTAYVQRFTGNSASTYAVYATNGYQYDTNGNLHKIFQPDGRTTTTFDYDMAGRKVDIMDPDIGVSTYGYDADGNLTKSVDARGTAGTVYAGYDGIDRVSWRNTTNSPTGAYATYSYDTKTSTNFGVGRLANETFSGGPNNSLSGRYDYSYDTRGEEITRTLTIANGCGTGCSVGTTYDDAGKTVTRTYPAGELLTYGYNGADWLTGVSTSQGSTTLLSNAAYAQGTNQFGGPAQQLT